MNFQEIPKVCINLKRSTKRREFVENEFKKNGLSVRFIEGVEGTDQNVPELSIKRGSDPLYYKGIFGCMASHLKAIKQSYDNGLEEVCIFEDDVVFCDDFKERIEYIDFITQTHMTLDGWDMILLGGHFDEKEMKIKNSTPTDARFIHKVRHAGGTYAYIIRRKAMEFVLRNCTYNFGMDEFFSTHVYPRFKVYAFVPFLVGCRPCESEISGEFINYENVSWYYRQETITDPQEILEKFSYSGKTTPDPDHDSLREQWLKNN